MSESRLQRLRQGKLRPDLRQSADRFQEALKTQKIPCSQCGQDVYIEGRGCGQCFHCGNKECSS